MKSAIDPCSYVSIFRDALHEVFNDPKLSPLAIARVAYESLLDSLGPLKAQMMKELPILLAAEWLKLENQPEWQQLLVAAITKKIDACILAAHNNAAKLYIEDYGKALNAAEEAWQQADPKQSST